jgi:hypothetical protein
MPKPKHRKNRKPMRDYGPLQVIWTNDDLTHAPAMKHPHVQADELAGIRMLTIWDHAKPSYITIGLYAAALRELGGEPDPADTLDDLRAKLTRAAADQALEAVKQDHP